MIFSKLEKIIAQSIQNHDANIIEKVRRESSNFFLFIITFGATFVVGLTLNMATLCVAGVAGLLKAKNNS